MKEAILIELFSIGGKLEQAFEKTEFFRYRCLGITLVKAGLAIMALNVVPVQDQIIKMRT